jgi:crossover junction endodeoxyribonuclease RuvC
MESSIRIKEKSDFDAPCEPIVSHQKNKVFLGIDPGQTGAIAVLGEYVTEVHDYPGDEVGVARLLWSFTRRYQVQLAALESVHAMPGQGVSSTFKFGTNVGIWRGVLAATHIPFLLVRPQEWQKGMIKKADGKKGSLIVARRMFPEAELHLAKHHNRADALLMAYWAQRQEII